MTASLSAIRDRGLIEERRQLDLLLIVKLAVLMAARHGRAAEPDAFRHAQSVTDSGDISQRILEADPEIGALLADFQEFAGQADSSRELTVPASERLMGQRHEMQPQPGASSGALSPREIEIVELIGQGRSNKEIARSLGIGPETVKTHVKNLFLKLGVERRAQAVLHAQALGLIRNHAT
jgi:LuxR family maltose regulon positive regulatory protein